MPSLPAAPCPRQETCPCPPSIACTAEAFTTCGMVNSVEYIAALLQRPYYLRMSLTERAAFLTDHFKVFIDSEEAGYAPTQVCAIIKARIDITSTNPS